MQPAQTPISQPKRVIHCDVCGRPVAQKARGTTKYFHRNCVVIKFDKTDLKSRIQRTIWKDAAHRARVRKELFQIICECFNQPTDIIQIPNATVEIEDLPDTMDSYYKCRLCGETYVSATVEKNPLLALTQTVHRLCGRTVRDVPKVDAFVIHACTDGGYGVADLQGLTPTPEASEASE